MSPRRAITIFAAFALAGCAGDPRDASPAAASARPAPRFVPPPDRFVRSALLSFDAEGDAAFVDARDVTLAADPSRPGGRSLLSRDATIKLGALVRGRDFPGPWDLVGVRIFSRAGGRCIVALAAGEPTHATALAAGEWTDVWLDLAALAGTRPTATTGAIDGATLSIRALDAAPLLIDDVAIAQSGIVVSASTVPQSGEPWQVRRAGLVWRALVGGHEVFALPAAPFASDGYRVVEAGPTRVLFTDDRGSTVCIDRTGRLIENGVARLEPRVLKFAKAIAENASPARVEVVGDDGRVERSLPGDRDNDGYDESRGCYAVRASAGRVRVRLTRRGATVKWPALEVYDLPPGTVSVWLEGQTVPWAARSDDGRVTVELPIELSTPVEVEVRVK